MEQIMSKASGGLPAVATSPSVVQALNYFGAKKISVATPYPDWSNERLKLYFDSAGFDVLNVEGEPWAVQAGPQGMNDQDPELIVEFASKVCSDDADALFCACTGWRAMEAAAELQAGGDVSPSHCLAHFPQGGHHPVNQRLRQPSGADAAGGGLIDRGCSTGYHTC